MSEPSPDQSAYLRIDALTKKFGPVTAVDEVSISIPKGEIFALLGSSGSGKSTLLRMLAGFEKPSSGAIYLDGQNIADFPPYERPINMMFQSYALFPHLSVADNIAFGLKRLGLPRDEISDRVKKMLDLVQLGGLALRKPHQLSGGQQQRVALARSLARSPQLLLLDEPLGALDKKLRLQTQFELVNIIESVGVTCVIVTHDQEEAMTMAARIAVMSHGRIMQIGSPHDVYETPNCRFVAEFIGDANLLEGQLSLDKTDQCQVQTPQALIHVGHGITGVLGAEVAVAIRPEKISIGLEAPEQTLNTAHGTVREIAYMGSYSTYDVALPDGKHLKVSQANASRHPDGVITWGSQVHCWWDDTAPVVLTS